MVQCKQNGVSGKSRAPECVCMHVCVCVCVCEREREREREREGEREIELAFRRIRTSEFVRGIS